MFQLKPQVVGIGLLVGILFISSLWFRGEFLITKEKLNTTSYQLSYKKQELVISEAKAKRLAESAKINEELASRLNSEINALRAENENFQRQISELNSDEDKKYLDIAIPPNVRKLLQRK